VSGFLAITPGFEAPPVQPAAVETSAKAAGQTKVPSVFANLIHDFAQEAAPRLPAPVANPKPGPRAPQQSTPSPGQEPVPQLSTAIELPPLARGDGRAAVAQSRSAFQSTVASISGVPVKDGDKPVAPPPAPSEATRRQAKSDGSRLQENSAPIAIDAALFMPVAPPISLKLPSFITHPSEGAGDVTHIGGGEPRMLPTSTAPQEQTLDLRPAPALELKIRAQDLQNAEQPATPAGASGATSTSKPPADQPTDTELPATATSGTQPRAEQIVHTFAIAAGPAAIEATPAQLAQMSTIAIPPSPVNPPQAININASSAPAPPPQAHAAHLPDEPASRQPEQNAQPLRSLSLEFAPDGAQDVRVRVAERAGDVHISLHSTDPALSGRLSDGVHELVGTLANAGYDAQAWTHGQGRQNHSEQNQAPPDDTRRNRRDNSADPGTEDFDAIMQQPIRIKP
jgi:hypothetical protein